MSTPVDLPSDLIDLLVEFESTGVEYSGRAQDLVDAEKLENG